MCELPTAMYDIFQKTRFEAVPSKHLPLHSNKRRESNRSRSPSKVAGSATEHYLVKPSDSKTEFPIPKNSDKPSFHNGTRHSIRRSHIRRHRKRASRNRLHSNHRIHHKLAEHKLMVSKLEQHRQVESC
jgi:hypothetical protein